jgi:HSP20 family protein
MALIRWEPFREVESLQRQMNQLFDSLTPLKMVILKGLLLCQPQKCMKRPTLLN